MPGRQPVELADELAAQGVELGVVRAKWRRRWLAQAASRLPRLAALAGARTEESGEQAGHEPIVARAQDGSRVSTGSPRPDHWLQPPGYSRARPPEASTRRAAVTPDPQ